MFLCVTGSREVEAVVRGPDGLKAGMKPGSVIVDCSTSDPVSTVALVEELKAAGIELVDAPLSRTPKEAWEGKLDTMVGASDDTFARLKPVIDAWAGKVVHIGAPGDGHRMKLLNNFISLGYAAIYAEALALSRKVGISPERFDSVIRGGRMDCGFYQTFTRWTLEGDPDAHKFTIANAYKDLRYLASMANAAGVAGAMADAVKNTFALAHGAGGDDDFVPMMASYVAHANGIDDGLYDKLPSQGGQVSGGSARPHRPRARRRALRQEPLCAGARGSGGADAADDRHGRGARRRRWPRASPATRPSAAPAGRRARRRSTSSARSSEEARPGRAALVDCVTLWLTNLSARRARHGGGDRRTGGARPDAGGARDLRLQRSRLRRDAAVEARARSSRIGRAAPIRRWLQPATWSWP